jgi:excisionase family DNA binding protein
MSYTLGQAAKATGMSKSTILRAIKSSKISAAKAEAGGEWTIDPAELHRVYPPVAERVARGNGDDAPIRVDELRQGWERERTLLEGAIDDLRNRLNAAEEERRTTLRQLTAILTDQRAQTIITPPPVPAAAPAREAPASGKRRWWRRGGRG